MQATHPSSFVVVPTVLPPNLDPVAVARQDSLDLLWTFIPLTVALGAMAIVLAWASLDDGPSDSPQLTAAVAAPPSASAALPAGPVEHLHAAALAPVIEPLFARVDHCAPLPRLLTQPAYTARRCLTLPNARVADASRT